MKSYRLIIFLLCFWLPLSSAANLAAPCMLLVQTLSVAEHQHNPCHQQQANLQKQSSDQQSSGDCPNCQVHCHALKLIAAEAQALIPVQFLKHYQSLVNPIPARIFLELPQRPPQIA